ncbi:gibberellin 2-beta-dioxygenase 6-like [Triticum aestivum]|uniref:gibberellin 2-beta-dioxygenase 6-like n=1 Tax=Triticum aestivum TaxID=4565 RepID=UPI001D01D6C3|nr:gibberellin 2-beta-dioxygenase 6-like [Triticum aestivum]
MPASAEVATTNDPPLVDSYCALLLGGELGSSSGFVPAAQALSAESLTVLQRDLPTIDLKRLTSGDPRERDVCADAMASAASEWGFFQVTNHGVGRELLEEMRREQAVLFHQPFDTKEKAGLVDGSYRWGNPTATSLRQLSWSEAFHVPLASICGEDCVHAQLSSLSLRYPLCPFADTLGMVPHTDSDFLTIVCQDQVGGLEIMNDSHWVAVKPHPDALVVNVGDLFQAWSNNRYKSVEHKVVANSKAERFSVAYFLCPSHDSLIGTYGKPSPYRPFTFGEYRRKVQDDVRQTGKKIGLPNFLKCSTIS